MYSFAKYKDIFTKLAGLGILFLPLLVRGQTDILLYNYNDLPQTVHSSPATIPRNSFTIGLPVVSGFYNRLHNNSFTVNQLFTERPADDSLVVNVDQVLNNLDEDKNLFSEYSGIDLMFFGIRINESYLTAGIRSNAFLSVNYPGEFVDFLWNGNASRINETVDFSSFNVTLNHYLSYYIGLAFRVHDRLNLGFRLKSLHGLSSIHFEKMNADITTVFDQNNLYQITANNDILINTSGIDDFGLTTENNFDLNEYLSGKKNSGFGLDLGINWKPSRNFNFSLSLLDIGYIYWNTKVKNYISENKNIEFDAIHVDVTDNKNILDVYLDTLSSMFKFNEISRHYTAGIPPRLLLGGYYTHLGTNRFGGLFYWRFLKGHTEKAFSLSYDKRFGNSFSFKLSWSAINNTYDNVGVGVSLHAGPIQIYFLTENVIGMFDPWNVKTHSLRLGLLVSILKKDDAKHYDLNQNEYYHFMPDKPSKREREQYEKPSGPPDLEEQIRNYWRRKDDKK